VCGRLLVEVKLFFVCFDEQSLDLCELITEIAVLAMEGPGLSGEFVEQEMSLEKRVELLVLIFDFEEKLASLIVTRESLWLR